MQHKKIPLAETKSFSSFFLDYIQQADALKPFYSTFPELGNFNKLLTKKAESFPSENRKVLVASLHAQYQEVDATDSVRKNIAALADASTFTVTTGHQLNIFTGPLYFIYKIVTVINACRKLKEQYPHHNFVPVYWMASEDHDFDEISYFRLYGNKYTWQTKQKGAVGRFKLDDIKSLLSTIPGDVSVFYDAYTKSSSLGDAVRRYVNALFGDEGLVVMDADRRELKALFQPAMRMDVFEEKTHALVHETNKKLESLKYEPQIFCREINFFYLDDQLRSRIEKDGDQFRLTDKEVSFSRSEMESIIRDTPEKLSPNVILRPLYQEVILPNVAYVGGPAEVIYWLQLKSVFDHARVPFPALMPRNFAMIVDHATDRKRSKTGLDIGMFFEPKNYLFNHWVVKNTHHHLTLGDERAQLLKIIEGMRGKAEAVDKTLSAYVGAEGQRALNSLEKIEKKLLRAEKRLHTDKLRQVEEVKDGLFPGGGLQERTDNFLNFYQQDNQFIAKLIRFFDPFDFSFNILTYTP